MIYSKKAFKNKIWLKTHVSIVNELKHTVFILNFFSFHVIFRIIWFFFKFQKYFLVLLLNINNISIFLLFPFAFKKQYFFKTILIIQLYCVDFRLFYTNHYKNILHIYIFINAFFIIEIILQFFRFYNT